MNPRERQELPFWGCSRHEPRVPSFLVELSDGIYAQLRAERVGSQEMASIVARGRSLDLEVKDQVVGGRVTRLWVHDGASQSFIDCDPKAARPVIDALERLLAAL